MCPNAVDKNTREDFVKGMYSVYWGNMARSMEGIWKVLAPITVSGTVIGAVHKNYLPAPVGISLAFVIILWALNVTIDLNAWHRRNLFFLVKTEQVFLSEQDYGRLLPEKYKRPHVGWITFYKINATTFVAFLILTILYVAIWKYCYVGFSHGWLLPFVVLAIGLIVTVINYRIQEKSARRQFEELFKEEDSEVN